MCKRTAHGLVLAVGPVGEGEPTVVRFGDLPAEAGALAVGTTVKLARALWTVPLTLGTAFVKRQEARIQWSWFILLFCLAAVVNTCLAAGREVYP